MKSSEHHRSNPANGQPAVQAASSGQSPAQVQLRAELVRQLVGSLGFLLRRQQQAYPFINTKFDLVSGQDFDAGDRLRGERTIYCWIQGRGLEALARHALWLRSEPSVSAQESAPMLAAIENLLPLVVASMERIRKGSGGRLPFMADYQSGEALNVDATGQVVPLTEKEAGASFSDLFYSKGLLAAAHYLNQPEWEKIAIDLFDATIEDIRSGRFRFGQVALDPKNPVQAVPGRFSHGGRMIAIGGITLFYQITGQSRYADLGREFIEHILGVHTLTDFSAGDAVAKHPTFKTGDLWEFVDEQAKPWHTGSGQIWSDPGHATEFVGLSLEHMRATGWQPDAVVRSLWQVLDRNFDNGFSGLGLIKAFDLAARKPINTDMPWWSLPETMRAAAHMLLMGEAAVHGRAEAVFNQCWAAFIKGYVNPELGFSAVQCLAADGSVAPVIPATPDADPGYHTGLSLIGCLPWLDSGQMASRA